MKPAAPKAAASTPRRPGKPRPGVERGDEVYFKAGDQHTHGRVASHGAHGCHIDHEGGRARVYWEDILGHKSRSAKSAKVVNQGDDGFLMEDDHGRRRFVAGEPPKPDETAADHDAVLEHARKATPLAKALGQLDELVKAHVSAYTKKDGTFVAAHDDKRVKRAPGQRSLFDQPAKKTHVTETPAFKKWFGDSKVVDASGKPLVVYHGTRHSFDEFMREGRKGRDRLHYFTVDPAIASEYAGGVQYGTPNVMPAYVSLQKPFTFDAAGDQWGSLPLDIFPDEISQHFDERNILRGRPGQTPRIGFTEVIRGALAAGYDGVVADNITDGGGEYGESHPSKVVVAHTPEQIKSASGNNGNFDPESPNMTKSIHDAPRVLFFKGGPLANRPGLTQKKITDKTGHQTTRWVRTNHDAPALKPGARVKFKAGDHHGEGEVTAAGEHGVTAKDSTGREHQIRHEEITHHQPAEATDAPKMYRGAKEAPGKFAWATAHKPLADEYAAKAGGKTSEVHVDVKNPMDFGHDRRHMTPSEFFASAAKGATGADKNAVMQARKQFLGEFGNESRNIVDYWQTDSQKNATSALLSAMGYDGIKVREGKDETETVASIAGGIQEHAHEAAASEKNKDDSNVVPMHGARSSEDIARALFDTSEIEKLPPKAFQPADNWADLKAKGEEGLVEFKDMLGKVAGTMGLVQGKRPQSFDNAVESEKAKAEKEGRAASELKEDDYMLPEHWDSDQGFLFMGPLKGEERASEKVRTDYDGDWSQVRDMVRATIAVPMVTQIPKVLSELKKAGIELAQKPKNNLVRPLPGGYRDLNLIVKLPNGLLAELQVHIKPMTLAKEKGHKPYETTRAIAGKYREKGVSDKTQWDPADQETHSAAMAEQEKLYGDAWAKATGEKSKSSDEEKDAPSLTKSLQTPIIVLWTRRGETK